MVREHTFGGEPFHAMGHRAQHLSTQIIRSCIAPLLRQRYGLSPEDQKDLTRSLVVELNPDTRTNVSVYAAYMHVP